MIIKFGTSMPIKTESDIFLIKCPFIEYKASIIRVSCFTVLYSTVEWKLGGAIGPLDNGVTSVLIWLT